MIRAVTVKEVGSRRGADVAAGEVEHAAVDQGVTGVGVRAGQGQGARADLGQGEGGEATVTDLSREVRVIVVAPHGERDRGDRVRVLHDAHAAEAAEDVAETVETEDAKGAALRREDVGRIGAEGIGGASQENEPRETGRTSVGIETREIDRRTLEAIDDEVVARQTADGAGDGERGTVDPGTVDGPGLVGTEHERGAEQDIARVGVDPNTIGRIGGSDGQGRGGLGSALRDDDAGDAARGGSEADAADGEVAIEGGHISIRRGTRGGAEDDVVSDAREALGVDGARGVGREVGVEVGVVQRGPADVGAHAPIEVGRQGRRGQGDRGVRVGEGESMSTEGPQVTEGVSRTRQAAGRGEEVIGPRGEAGQTGQVDDDTVRSERRTGRADAVEGRGSADVEAEGGRARGAGSKVEDARAERDSLADGVIEVEDRAGVDLDGRRAQRGGLTTGEVEATCEDSRLTDVGKRRASERQGADAGLDEPDVILVGPETADGAIIDGGDVLVDGEVRDRGGSADEGVVADAAQSTDDDRSGITRAAGDRDNWSKARTIAARIGDGDPGDDAVQDRGHRLSALRAHETADGVKGDGRS